jgi:hypothetical protein
MNIWFGNSTDKIGGDTGPSPLNIPGETGARAGQYQVRAFPSSGTVMSGGVIHVVITFTT